MMRPEVMLILLLAIFTAAYVGLLVWVECVLPRRRRATRLRRVAVRELVVDELDEFAPAARGTR